MTAPTVPLEDMQSLTSALLACGARIDEINTLRRHLDRVKGGGIAKATKAHVLSLILSDVVGSPLEAIASGPTAPDPTTKDDALAVLDKYFEISRWSSEAEGRIETTKTQITSFHSPFSIMPILKPQNPTIPSSLVWVTSLWGITRWPFKLR